MQTPATMTPEMLRLRRAHNAYTELRARVSESSPELDPVVIELLEARDALPVHVAEAVLADALIAEIIEEETAAK